MFLDEPTTGLDPSGRRETWELIRRLAAGGTTVLLTTHYMDEVEALADRVAVLFGQEIVASGTPASIGGRDLGAVTIRFRLPEGVTVESLPVPAEPSEDGHVEIHTEDEVRVLHDLTGLGPRGRPPAAGSLGAADLPGGHLPRADPGRGVAAGRGAGHTDAAAEGGAMTTTETPVKGSFRGLSDVPLVARQVGFEQLSFWLNPVGAVLTIGFSLVFIVIFLSTSRHSTVSFLSVNLGQYYVPAFVAYGVMAACFNILAITMVNRREMGLLKRLRLSPLPTWMLLAAVFVNRMIIALIQVVLVLLLGRFGYGVHGPHDVGTFLLILSWACSASRPWGWASAPWSPMPTPPAPS